MAILSADQFPGAERQPLAYPGVRPEFSYIYYRGQVYQMTPRGATDSEVWVDTPTGQVTLEAFLAARENAPMCHRHAVLAVGSNGCPGRLAEKYAGDPKVAVPVFVGTLNNTAVVYSSRLVPYGALPATYLHVLGAVSWLSVTMLSDEQLERMDQTEGVGQIYQRIEVAGELHVKDGPRIGDLTAYLDRNILTYMNQPVLVKMFARKGPKWPTMDQQEVMSMVLDQAGLFPGEPMKSRHRQLLRDDKATVRLSKFLAIRMSGLMVDKHGRLSPNRSIKCIRVRPTGKRPGSRGTYIVRLCPENQKILNVKNGDYLRVSYGNAAVLARLSVDKESHASDTIWIDQTLRFAIGLPKFLEPGQKDWIYNPEDDASLAQPVSVQRSEFQPSWLGKAVKQEYIVCILHHALPTDMESTIARLRQEAMEILGIEEGDKVILISDNGRTKSIRCLPLDPGMNSTLPLVESMQMLAHPPLPLDEYKGLHLAWCTLDQQTRFELDADLWEPIIVGRDPSHALRKEYTEVALAVALGAVGGALLVEKYFQQNPWIAGGTLIVGFIAVFLLICIKIRSKV